MTAAPLRLASDDRRFLGHPRGLALLFIAEMWERFSYYGMRALLVLYLVNKLGWSDAKAYHLYGTYTGLVWLTPLIGGYVADRFLGTHRALMLGGVIIAAGHFTLALAGMTAFYVGLALVILGTGLFKPNASTMVGQLYAEGDPRRDAGFTIFYMGINLGATIAPLICSYLGERIGWDWGFGAAGVGMVIGMICYAVLKRDYLGDIGNTPARVTAAATAAEHERVTGEVTSDPAKPWHGIVGALAGGALAWVTSGGGWVAVLTGATIAAAAAMALLSSRGDELKRVVALCIVVFFVIFFWMAFEQAGSSMNVFADRHTNRQVGSFEIPAGWFQSVQPFTLLIFAPMVAALWTRLAAKGREPATAMKMVWGLALVGASFLFMMVAGRSADVGVKASAMWLIAAYSFQSLGELAVSPIGLSYVTKVAPARLAALLMGVWFLSNSAANKIGGWLAAQTEHIASLSTFFSIPVATSFGAAIALLALVPLLKRLTASVQA